MQGKTCVVTGANAGLGLATATALAEKGARVIMVCRNPERGETARKLIAKAATGEPPELLIADLASQRQIRELGKAIRQTAPVLDVLVNNAGVWYSDYSETEDGIETVFAVNHLAYVLLTHMLYPALREAEEGRIVNVSSDSHFKSSMHFDDLSLRNNYHGLRSYGQSKIGNVMFTLALDKRKQDPSILVNAVQPGLVNTDIGVKHTIWWHALAWKVRTGLFRSKTPAEGASTSIFLASSDEAAGQSGKYWDKCKAKPPSEEASDPDKMERLWKISLDLCGIEDFFSDPLRVVS